MARQRRRKNRHKIKTYAQNPLPPQNNPAAAALRATGELHGTLQQLRDVVAWLASANLSSDRLLELVNLQRDGPRAARPSMRSGLELANAEEVLGDWLVAHQVENSWSLASTLASAGLEESWLEKAATVLTAD